MLASEEKLWLGARLPCGEEDDCGEARGMIKSDWLLKRIQWSSDRTEDEALID